MTGLWFGKMARAGAVLVTIGVLTIASQRWQPVPFPVVVGGIVPACLLGLWAIIAYERHQLRIRTAHLDRTDDQIAEYVRLNQELTRELLESRQIEETQLLQVRALDAFLQGVIITDPTRPDNPIVFANEGFTRLTGYTKEDYLGKNCRFLQGPDTNPAALTVIRDAIATRRPCTVEILNYRKDGSTFWNALSIAPIFEEGQLTHFVGVQTDVSALKQMEHQLRQASKMEAIGHLAGGIAHDFNNLLTVINGCCELLRLNPAHDPHTQTLLSEVDKAGQRAATMTRQLLTFSRKAVLQPRVLSLNELVADFQKLLIRLIGEDIQLVTQLQPKIGNVRVDQGQMEHALMNLVVNARDAMPQGGRLTITTSEETFERYTKDTLTDLDCGEYVCLRVTDTGCGMDQATMLRVFEPFFTTKPVGKGTGLGLAMVYGFVKSSGGDVSVKSERNVGTTFTIRLPVIHETAHGAGPMGPILQPRGTETILLVEDEDGVRQFAASVLRKHGYQVLEASNGHEALQMMDLIDEPIHLLLTDVVMPMMSGRELAEHLRVQTPEIRVIFTSGYTNDEVLQHGVSEAESDFLQKPFTIESLLRKTREVLDRQPNVLPPLVAVS